LIFFLLPFFLSPKPWYACRVLKNSIVSSNLYLFFIWSSFFWFIFFFRFDISLSLFCF
jgi:hypothetical protein